MGKALAVPCVAKSSIWVASLTSIFVNISEGGKCWGEGGLVWLIDWSISMEKAHSSFQTRCTWFSCFYVPYSYLVSPSKVTVFFFIW
jgi:hypothetical protein